MVTRQSGRQAHFARLAEGLVIWLQFARNPLRLLQRNTRGGGIVARSSESMIFTDGNQAIDQSGHGVKFLSHGTREYPHDPVANVAHGSDFAALQRDEKFCSGCGNWRPKIRYNDAENGRITYDGKFPVCQDCQRIMFPHTLGLRWCSKCADWIEASAFGQTPHLCRRHAAEATQERVQRFRERRVTPSLLTSSESD